MSIRDDQYAHANAVRLHTQGRPAVYRDPDGVEFAVVVIVGSAEMKPSEDGTKRSQTDRCSVETPKVFKIDDVAVQLKVDRGGVFVIDGVEWGFSEHGRGVPGMYLAILQRQQRVQSGRRTGMIS